MRILLTGSEGAIGQFILRRMHNMDVIRVSRSAIGEFIYNGDLRDRFFAQKVTTGVSHIIHCAARWNGYNNDHSILNDNVSMMLNLLMNAGGIKKFVLLSSSGVYDGQPNYEEDAAVSPTSSYGLSKLLCEKLVKVYAGVMGFDFTVWRLFNVVSPAEKYCLGSSHVFTNFFHRIVKNNERLDPAEIKNDKEMPFSWVEDISDCIVDNLNNHITANNTFNIGSSVTYNLHELLSQFYQFLFGSGYRHIVDGKKNTYFEKASRLLGWQSHRSLHDMVERFISYARS